MADNTTRLLLHLSTFERPNIEEDFPLPKGSSFPVPKGGIPVSLRKLFEKLQRQSQDLEENFATESTASTVSFSK